MAQIKTEAHAYVNRCQRCNRQLKNSSAQYGWRCAEILGVTQNLNYAGDRAFNAYTLGINEAKDFLRKNNIDSKKIDLVKFYESYAKQYLAAGMNNRYLHRLAYDDMRSSLSPGYDKNGKMIVTDPLSPTLDHYIAWRDHVDAVKGKFSTTVFTNNKFNPYAFQLQIRLNQSGTTDKFGNKLKEDGIFGPKTQWAMDVARILGDTGKGGYIGGHLSKYGIGARGETSTAFGIFDKSLRKTLENGQKVGGSLFRIDGPHTIKTGNIPYPHVNYDNLHRWPNLSKEQTKLYKKANHTEIPQSVFNFAKSGNELAKIAKNGGKALAVAGIVLDTYELGSTIYLDLNDEDKKLGKNTIKTSIGIGSSYAGGLGGAKLGTMGGTAIGTAICPGLGTIIGGILGSIGGGITGAIGGRAFGEHVVDKTYKEE